MHAGGHLPSVTIEYRDVEIEADALVGSSSIPSLTNATWHFLKVGTLTHASRGSCRGLHAPASKNCILLSSKSDLGQCTCMIPCLLNLRAV